MLTGWSGATEGIPSLRCELNIRLEPTRPLSRFYIAMARGSSGDVGRLITKVEEANL
jgi:hypothetical protein